MKQYEIGPNLKAIIDRIIDNANKGCVSAGDEIRKAFGDGLSRMVYTKGIPKPETETESELAIDDVLEICDFHIYGCPASSESKATVDRLKKLIYEYGCVADMPDVYYDYQKKEGFILGQKIHHIDEKGNITRIASYDKLVGALIDTEVEPNMLIAIFRDLLENYLYNDPCVGAM